MTSLIDEVDETTTTDSNSGTETETDDTATEDGAASEDDASSRGAESRINELLARNKELEKKLDMIADRMAPPAPRTSGTEKNPEVEKARDYLKSQLGVVTKDDLEQRLKDLEDRQILLGEHGRLESHYDGSDGRPRYDRTGVEEYMRKNAVYNPEVAYKALHETELFDWGLKKSEDKKKQPPYVEKRGQAVNQEDNTITREKIAEWMKTSEGRLKYEQNRDKILKLMQQGAL